jgi:hypothetical protein
VRFGDFDTNSDDFSQDFREVSLESLRFTACSVLAYVLVTLLPHTKQYLYTDQGGDHHLKRFSFCYEALYRVFVHFLGFSSFGISFLMQDQAEQ